MKNEGLTMTQYICVNEREASGMVKRQGVELVKVHEIKYLVPTINSNEGCSRKTKRL